MITVVLDPADEQSRSLWHNALSLMGEFDGDWTLVGGLMVQLLAVRYGVPSSRLTIDIDILADSRRRPSSTERIGTTLTRLGFEVVEQARLRDPETAFRFERAGTIVDLIAPEKTGRRTTPKTVGNFQTIEVPGGTQALARTEALLVRLDDTKSTVRTPTLLGAILLKARAIRSGHRDQDRDDLVVLLACVEDPIALREDLERTERGWLRSAEEALTLDGPDLPSRFGTDQLDRARAAYRLLTRS
jgi:nucleotidyltransferase AbiEii toxin of type IV toxin-antitoxin system